MAVLPIVVYGDPVLREKALPVVRVDADIRQLLADMHETMVEAPGIGLAANQVGRLVRCLVASVDDDNLLIVNPRIVSRRGSYEAVEACLSLPGLQATVPRAERVVVAGLNRNGRPTKVEAEGLLARCLQHEIDHLDGIVFPDRALPGSLHWVREEGVDEEGEPILVREDTTWEEAQEAMLERRRQRLAVVAE